jgi:hypothetical protein
LMKEVSNLGAVDAIKLVNAIDDLLWIKASTNWVVNWVWCWMHS